MPAPRRRVEQDGHGVALLGVQRELEVVGLVPLQRLVEHRVHRHLVVVDDEVAHEVPPRHLVERVPGDLGRLVVPLVDAAERVGAEDRRVRRVDQPLQVERHPDHLLLGVLALGDVLPHADDADGRRRLGVRDWRLVPLRDDEARGEAGAREEEEAGREEEKGGRIRSEESSIQLCSKRNH